MIFRLAGFAFLALLLAMIAWSIRSGAKEPHYGNDPVRSLSTERRQMLAYTDPWRLKVRISTRNKHSQFIGSPVVPYLGRIVRLDFDESGERLHVAYEHGDVVYHIQETSGRIRARIASINMNEAALDAR